LAVFWKKRGKKLTLGNYELDYNYTALEKVIGLSWLALCKGAELQGMSQETAILKAAPSLSRTACGKY